MDKIFEEFQKWLDEHTADLSREDYRGLLHEIDDECTIRLRAMDEDEEAAEE